MWPSLTALPPDLSPRGLCLYNTELNTCKMRGKPVAERVVWLHHLYYWVRAQAREKKSLPPSSMVSTWVTSKDFVFYCQLLEGSPPGLWYLVEMHGLCPWDASKGAHPAEAAHPCLLCVISEAHVKAPCSFESIQALSTPHHDSTQTPLKICSKERYLLLSLQSTFKKTKISWKKRPVLC